MNFIINMISQFKNNKNSNKLTINGLTISTVTQTQLPQVPVTTKDNTTDSNSVCINKSTVNSVNSKENPENASLIKMNNACNSSFNVHNLRESAENTNTFILDENLTKEKEKAVCTQEINTNNEQMYKKSHLDENTLNCIKEFDTILANVENSNEIIDLDEFDDIFQEFADDGNDVSDNIAMNIDTEDYIPVNIIGKDFVIQNKAVETYSKTAIKEGIDITTAVEEHDYSSRVDNDIKLTEIEVDEVKVDSSNKSESADTTDLLEVKDDVKLDETMDLSSNRKQNYNKIQNLNINIKKEPVATAVVNNIKDDKTTNLSNNELKNDKNVDKIIEISAIKDDNDSKYDKNTQIVTIEAENVIETIELSATEIENDIKVVEFLELSGTKVNNVIKENKNIQTVGIVLENDEKVGDNIVLTPTELDKDKTAKGFSIKTEEPTKTNNTIDNIETISISSDEIINLDTISISSDENSSDCGYHSSDFEFISENEAKLDGFIINFKSENTSEIPERTPTHTETIPTKPDKKPEIEETPGPSGLNNYESYRNKYSKPLLIDYSYRDSHEVPVGEAYLDLFRGFYDPTVAAMEKKSFKSSRMLLEFEGMGFERQLFGRRRDSDEDEYEEEANVTAKKILQTYPTENRKRRRRF